MFKYSEVEIGADAISYLSFWSIALEGGGVSTVRGKGWNLPVHLEGADVRKIAAIELMVVECSTLPIGMDQHLINDNIVVDGSDEVEVEIRIFIGWVGPNLGSRIVEGENAEVVVTLGQRDLWAG